MPEPVAGGRVTEPQSDRTVGEVRVRRVLPLYLVVFVGFVGYSLMIAIFTPLVLRVDGRMLPHDTSAGARAIALAVARRCSIVLGVAMATIVIPDRQAALWLTLGVTALALAICLPAAAAIISGAVRSDEQGNALGTN